MSDVFEKVVVKYRGTPSALVLFGVSLIMLLIGLNHFFEDVYSSYIGLVSIEQHFRLNVQMWEWTYWTMSGSLQVATMVFFYVFLADTSKRWAWFVAVGAQLIDFLSDLWFRSNGAMFTDWGVTVVGGLITFFFFTVGSEVFISFGFGICLKLAAPAVSQWKIFRTAIQRAKAGQDQGNQSSFRQSSVYQQETETKKDSQPLFSFGQSKNDRNKHNRR